MARALKRWADYEDPLPYVLAEYNAGRTHALRWAKEAKNTRDFWERITFPTTKRYVEDVLERYRGGV